MPALAPARGAALRAGLAVLVVAFAVYLAARDRALIGAGAALLSSSDGSWLVVAGLAAVSVLVGGTITQYGSLSVRPPFRSLFAVQVAASFADHLLPAGAGGVAVNVRYLCRRGLSSQAALAAQALNHGAGAAAHLLLLVVAVSMAPEVLARLGGVSADHLLLPLAAFVAVVALLAVVRLALPASSLLRVSVDRSMSAVVTEVRALRAVMGNPVRALQLWLGSLSVPLLHALVLIAALRAVHAPISVRDAAVVYLAASALSSLLPSPGGFGALDVALSAGLVGVGVPAPTALAAVMAYRLFTVWAPLLPGACVLGVLVRRRII